MCTGERARTGESGGGVVVMRREGSRAARTPSDRARSVPVPCLFRADIRWSERYGLPRVTCMELSITTLAERPELAGALDGMPDTWPEFVLEDIVGWANFARIAVEFPQYVLVATDPEGVVVARAYSVPFVLDAPGRGELPVGGWDRMLLWAFADLRRGRTPDTVGAIEITVATGHQGKGISGRMLAALRDNARRQGFREVVAPVRPSGKHVKAGLPMEEYARLTRPDGRAARGPPGCGSTPGPAGRWTRSPPCR
ncbi:hypothetical protein GA0115255_113145 [Streptomyces sp. Ncost-T6T-2b]|nr:hypothetical protein GA0115255_113145 [Streptomyces sp. Ncost-T6T-2b]